MVSKEKMGDLSMRNPVQWKHIPQNTPEFTQMQEFAKTFDHHIVPHCQTNLFSTSRDGVLFGYTEFVDNPIAFPAYHPMFTKPSDVLQCASDFRASCQLSGKAGYIGIPFSGDRPNFPENILAKLGFGKVYRELYLTS
jgi:hypothetical protein